MTKSTPEMQRALVTVQNDWNAAGAPWNPDALAARYTADALFYGGRPGHSIGQDAIRNYFASYIGVIEQGRMTWVDPQCSELSAESFLAQGYVDFAFTLSAGRETRSRLRATWVVVHAGQGARIRLHHFSPTPDVPPLGDR